MGCGSAAGGTMRKAGGPVVPIGHAHVGLIPHDSTVPERRPRSSTRLWPIAASHSRMHIARG